MLTSRARELLCGAPGAFATAASRRVEDVLSDMSALSLHAGVAATGGGGGLGGRLGWAFARQRDAAACTAAHASAAAVRASQPGYAEAMRVRQLLPTWARRADIAASIRTRPVTIVSGETGSGKSTQVPQFILDDAVMGPTARIIVTQVIVTRFVCACLCVCLNKRKPCSRAASVPFR